MKTPRLYIIHGWTYTTDPWTQTLEILKKRGIDARMLFVPGLTSPSDEVWTIEKYVEWADKLIPRGAVALGHSNGGRILLNLCSQKPDKLKHLILLDAAGVYEESAKRDVSRTVSKKLKFLKRIPGLEKIWHKLTGASDYDRAPANMKQTLANMLASDKDLDLTKVKTPTSILWGEEDNITPVRQAKVMHERIAGSTLKIFPGWNHAPYILHPEELADAIQQAYFHPPEKAAIAAEATAGSAALALKKAPEPVLKAPEPTNSVTPNVATRLVLRKDEKITQGMVISDEEGAAVRYQVKAAVVPTKNTDASQMSASATFRMAKNEVVPDIDAVADSASASLRKDRRTNKDQRLSKRHEHRLRLVRREEHALVQRNTEDKLPIVSAEPGQLARTDLGNGKLTPTVPEPVSAPSVMSGAEQSTALTPVAAVPGAITSASVEKVGRLEKARRKVRGMSSRSKRTQEVNQKVNPGIKSNGENGGKKSKGGR